MSDLFAGFSAVSFETWKEQIVKDLKGINFDDLIHTDGNGLAIFPFYNKENSVAAAGHLSQNQDWSITQAFVVVDELESNKQILNALNAGVEAIRIDLGEKKYCDFELLLKDVNLPYIQTVFEVAYPSAMLVYQFKDYLQNLYPNQEPIDYCFRYDPIAGFLKQPKGFLKPDEESCLDFYKSAGAAFRLFVDASLYQNAGANSAFQLGASLAHLNEYIEFLKGEIKPGTKINVCVQTATGTLFFEEISKLRALRRLVALLLEEHQIIADVQVGVETSDLYRSPSDAYTNLLRDTISGMSGVLGGCDSLEIHGFNASVNDEQLVEFGSHLARNQQLIFKEEAYLNKVADIGHGSFFIEQRTEELAMEGWKVFQEIEAHGGLLASFEGGWLENQIKQQAQVLIQQYKEGERVLIGVNKYPNPSEGKLILSPAPAENTGIVAINIAREIL